MLGALAAAVALMLALGACSGVKSADIAYVDGAGTVVKVAPADRKEPVELRGEQLGGGELDVADHRGQVVVLNVWGSWCAPCIEETPDLVAAAEELVGDDVAFLGINGRESEANALAYQRKAGLPYPSFFDEGGRLRLGLRSAVPPQSFPATVLLDPQGRVAVTVLGKVTQESLTSLVGTVLHESAADATATDSADDSAPADATDPAAPTA